MRHYGRFSWINTRLGFVLLLVVLIWAKTLLADFVDFNLFSGATPVQYVTLLINPLTVSSLLIGLAFYFRSAKLFYPIATIMYIVNIVLLQLNVTYYRELQILCLLRRCWVMTKLTKDWAHLGLR